uniref:Uncharacterized protein n=1 Tax=Siphoviridae sp. ctLAG1 TaxID=2826248 RepID=A0A8S5MFS1_9CAUD|nr:MAG TPA: hypothetical protein [Siphoviridae sp. ctLAG1]
MILSSKLIFFSSSKNLTKNNVKFSNQSIDKRKIFYYTYFVS